MSKMVKKFLKRFIVLSLILAGLYGMGRLYYRVTDGFMISNITSELAYNERWVMPPLSSREQSHLDEILSQKFTYLGKGCQSYVFLSEDGNYVVKFFKYQRFRLQPWLNYFSFIPAVDNYRQRKIEKKQAKLEAVFESWKLAFEELQPETGLMYVHLNKTKDLNKRLVIVDKIGREHILDLDSIEFLVQRKVQMLCPYIRGLIANGDTTGAQNLLMRILKLTLSEYQRGLADNDHALMQNTGVANGKPMHVDVGQIVRNESVKNSEVYKQELFNKTYKFRAWLRKNDLELAEFFEVQLINIIGPKFFEMQPHFKQHE